MKDMAKIFWNGRSQAVRLPKAYRFEGTQVRISREGNRIVLEAQESDHEWAERLAGSMDESMAMAIEEGRLGPESMPDGPDFD